MDAKGDFNACTGNDYLYSFESITIIQFAENYESEYDLDNYNCTDFALDLGLEADMVLPDTKGFWDGGGGSNPGSLGQDIRNLTSNSNMIVNTSGGNAPINTGSCN